MRQGISYEVNVISSKTIFVSEVQPTNMQRPYCSCFMRVLSADPWICIRSLIPSVDSIEVEYRKKII